MTKSELIKQSLNKTREKRKNQICKSFEMKVDKSHLSTALVQQLEQLFREGRWLYNHILHLISEDGVKLQDINTSTIKSVQVKRQDAMEEEELCVISSQMKQSIHTRISNALSALSSLKKKGKKVGRLKYKNQFSFNCIPLKQFNNTFKIISDKYMTIQSIKGKIKVHGLDQIKQHYEIADAKLIKKNKDYYIRITCYINKEDIPEIEYKAFSVGIDFGMTDQLALSNGQMIQYQIPTSKRTKKEQKNLTKKTKKSKNYNKTRNKIRKAHSSTNNKKKDTTNKIVHALSHTFKHIIYQDENLKFFQKGHGKKIQNTRLGGIITKLEHLDTSIQVSRYFPSTKLCFCGYKKKDMKLSERTYICPECGLILQRDYKSSISIEEEGLRCSPQILTERKDFKPAEKRSSAIDLKDCFVNNPYIKVRTIQNTLVHERQKQEATAL